MKKLLVLALTAVLGAGCGMVSVVSHLSGPQIVGSGKVTTVKRSVAAFKAVRLEGAMDADITIGKQTDIEITGDDNIAPLVKTEIQGETLRVYLEGSYSTNKNLVVKLSLPELKSTELSGSGDIAVHQFAGKSLGLSIKGSGSITADGKADSLDASISGSGDLNLYKLEAQNAKVSIAGSGDAEISAIRNLDVSISGSGDVTYHGKPQVTKSIAGSGGVTAGE